MTCCGRPSTISSAKATRSFPNLIQLGLWLATQTKRLKFGCAFNVLPMWHPIRLAEDYAMADIVTDGRVIMGVGRGYHTREVETFGAPLLDAEKNRELFEEQLRPAADLLQRAVVPFQGQVLRMPAAGGLSRLSAQGHHDGAAAQAPAGRDLDADRQRQDHRADGAIGPQGDGDAERREDPRRRGARLPRRLPQARPQQAARRGHDLGRRRLSRRQPGRGDAPGRAGA